jgi:hypothetical protein
MTRFRVLLLAAILAVFLGCTPPNIESSTELDLSKLRPFLKQVQPLVEDGFGDSQIDQIEKSFRGLAMDGKSVTDYPVVYHGAKTTLRIQIRKEDFDTVEIRLWASPELAGQITGVMRSLPY